MPPSPSPPPPLPHVLSVSANPTHKFTKPPLPSISLVLGHGVKGDCHAGPTVQHRSRLKIRPAPPNLRQVHLMPVEILDEVCENGDDGGEGKRGKVLPGELGENITTVGIDLLGLEEGTILRFVDDDGDHHHHPHPHNETGDLDATTATTNPPVHQNHPPPPPSPPPPAAPPPSTASIRITGLRNPCPQIEKFRKGLQERFIVRDEQRKIVARKAGVMAVVESSGVVRPGMRIVVVVAGGGGGKGDGGGNGGGGEGGFRALGCV